MRKVIAFDLEIVKEIPPGCADWRSIRPLGISCAATAEYDENGNKKVFTWFHGEPDNPIPGAMTQFELSSGLLLYLQVKADQGFTILTWNGLQFDFDVLAEESGHYQDCIDLAMNSIDMMYQVVCTKGYPLGLDTVAKGLGLPGKTEGMHGDLAPAMWAGSLEERLKVLEYVQQDAQTTLDVYLESVHKCGICWTSKTGRRQSVYIGQDWKTVTECNLIPKPDTSWMTNPMTRESFYAWIPKAEYE